jgi:menaquinone-dependent protoporphyrinogen IX oxidase
MLYCYRLDLLKEIFLKNALIVFESKYGNTKLVAEAIATGLRKAGGFEVNISEVATLDHNRVASANIVIIGSPNHMGSALKSVTSFIDSLSQSEMEHKQFAVFDTFMGGDFEKAAKKMEAYLKVKLPNVTMASSHLSIKVNGTKGPIADLELPKAEEFGTRIGTSLQ